MVIVDYIYFYFTRLIPGVNKYIDAEKQKVRVCLSFALLSFSSLALSLSLFFFYNFFMMIIILLILSWCLFHLMGRFLSIQQYCGWNEQL